MGRQVGYRKLNEFNIISDVVEMKLSNTGNIALIDLEDWNRAKVFTWYENNGYAFSNQLRKTISLHRFIMKRDKGETVQVDHIFHNTLDNRKSQLRICSVSENQMNKVMQKNNTSGIVGVVYYKITQKWRANIRVNDKQINLGYFHTIKEAIKARLDAEKIYQGEFAYNHNN